MLCITSMYDSIHSNYGEKTLVELKAKENNPFLIAVSDNTIIKLTCIHKDSLCEPSRNFRSDSIDVLPPIHLKDIRFFVGEPHYGNLYPFHLTIGGRYIAGVRSVRTISRT